MIKVCKFGGSSVSSAESFRKVRENIEADPARRIVVTSAIGKADKSESKITDLLYLLHAHIKYKVNYDQLLASIKARFYRVKDSLGLSTDLDAEFATIEANMKSMNEDYLVSRGEYLTAHMLADFLGFGFIDAADIMKFDYNGKINLDATEEAFNRVYEQGTKVVIPGFYGTYPNGDIKLFSRGGSDISGAIVARAIHAKEYENFTDVNGFYVSDPRFVANPKLIKEITYDELRELSYMGANVIHEDTLLPIEPMGIPLHILNTFNPASTGTLISRAEDLSGADDGNIITGVTGKKGFVAINIAKSKASSKLDVIASVLGILKRFDVNVESIPTSIDSFSVVVEDAKLGNKIYDIISEIKALPGVVSVGTDNDISLISVVGRNMVLRPGISAKIFSSLGDSNVNIKLISQNTSEISITVGVKSSDFEKAINVIYRGMVG